MSLLPTAPCARAAESAREVGVAALDGEACAQKPMALLAKSRSKRSTGKYTVIACSVGFLVMADIFAFGRGGRSLGFEDILAYSPTKNIVAELTLIVTVTLLLISGSKGLASRASPSRTKDHKGGLRTAQEWRAKGGASIGGHLSSTSGRAVPSGGGGSPSAGAPASCEVSSKFMEAIELAAREGDKEKAEELVLEFERSGALMPTMSYNWVIRACAKRGDADAAERWLQRMESRGGRANTSTYNTLLDACAKADKPEACEGWLRRMLDTSIEPNIITYATAICAFARHGDVESAEAWLSNMVAAGIEPDEVSYGSLLHACSIKGDAERAEYWLGEMESRGLVATVSAYTAMIDSSAKRGDVDTAEVWFAHLVERGVEPNSFTFSAMIHACAKARSLARAEAWYEKMVEQGVAPCAHSYSAMINACAKQGGPGSNEAAERWLDRAEQAGAAQDAVLYSGAINACGNTGDAEGAMRIFDRMRARGIKPHLVVYSTLARPFAYRGDWIKVEVIARALAADGLKVNDYFLYAQLLAYGAVRPREAERAEACFRSAHKAGVEANDQVVGVLCRAVGRPRCVELMEELCGGREVPLRGLPRRKH